MQFTRKGKYYSESVEGYTVCVTFSGSDGKRMQFTAWTPKKGGHCKIIDIFDNSEDAYQACKDHYESSSS